MKNLDYYMEVQVLHVLVWLFKKQNHLLTAINGFNKIKIQTIKS